VVMRLRRNFWRHYKDRDKLPFDPLNKD
jgi:hypothetical protein